jgi:hypothetical protein
VKMPFMPFYGQQFCGDMAVKLMEPAERWMYIELLWTQWKEGFIPVSDRDLRMLIGATVPARVVAMFPITEPDHRQNAALEAIREKHEHITAARSAAGIQRHNKRPAKPLQNSSNDLTKLVQSSYKTPTNTPTNAGKLEDRRQKTEELPEEGAGAPPTTEELGRMALAGYQRAHRHPGSLEAELQAIASGMHPPAVPWDILWRALAEMQANGMPFNVALLRGVCRRLQAPEGVDEVATVLAKVERDAARAQAAREAAA